MYCILKHIFAQERAPDLHPMGFPVVLSRQLYSRQTDLDIDSGMNCDESGYVNEPMNITKINGKPSMRNPCEVLVYVVPLPCRTWFLQLKDETVFEDHLSLIPKEMIEMTTIGVKYDKFELKTSRSVDFIVILGQEQTSGVPYYQNIIPKLADDKNPRVTMITPPTKIFLKMEETPKGGFKNLGMYLITASWGREIHTGYGNVYETLFNLIKLPNILLAEQLNYFVGTQVHKRQTMWYDHCTNCVHQNRYVFQNELTRLSGLSDMPDKELAFLILLFPNSTIMSGMQFIGRNIRHEVSILIRNPFPVNATLYFRPVTGTDGYYFVTCCDVGENGAFSLTGLVSAYDDYTWIWISLGFVVTPALLINTILQGRLSDVILNSFSILLEQGCFENILRRSKWIAVVSLFMGIILSTTYKGDNITALTAPRPQARWVWYDELFARNFSYFMSFDLSWQPAEMIDMLRTTSESLGMLSEKDINADLDSMFAEMMNPEREISIVNDMHVALHGGIVNESNQVANNIFRSIYWPSNRVELKNFSYFKYFLPRLAKCKREAYIGQRIEVTIISEMLNHILMKEGRYTQVISVGSESFSRLASTWKLRDVQVPSEYLFMRVHLLWQSGFVELWDAWDDRAKTWNSSHDNAIALYEANLPRALKMANNVVVIFYLFLTLLALSCLVFLKEMRWASIGRWICTKAGAVIRRLEYGIILCSSILFPQKSNMNFVRVTSD